MQACGGAAEKSLPPLDGMITVAQLRNLLIYMVVFPLMLVAGMFLATPHDFQGIAFVGLLFMAATLPLVLQWHHVILITTWNAAMNAFFLPGQPDFWVAMAFVSLLFSILKTGLDKKTRLQYEPSVAWPLVFIAAVVVFTAVMSGGFGFRVFGGAAHGAKRYIFLLGAVVGFFALSCVKIPKERAQLYAGLFFLSGVTAMMSDLIYMAGPSFYVLYYLFPVKLAIQQAASEGGAADSVFRLEGLAWAMVAFYCFMLVRYGIRGIFDIRRPWRLAFFFLAIGASLFGGFRGRLVIMAMLFGLQFYFEGLFKRRLGYVLLTICMLTFCSVLPFANKLPLSVQRSLSFLPVNVDPVARQDADETIQWRLDMWRIVWPEVPNYLWIGKGYTYSPTDYFLMEEAERRGMAKNYETALIVGNYHNGPLTILVLFGIPGMVGFIWFAVAALRVLWRNYKYGDPAMLRANTFLLTFFITQLAFFTLFYGQFAEDLFIFTGVVGLSIALNGVAKRRLVSQNPIPLRPNRSMELAAK